MIDVVVGDVINPELTQDTAHPEVVAHRRATQRVESLCVRLQELIPDAVLVGGSAAALYAGHRDSYDHDHVLADLADRFDAVLEAVESQDGWVTNRITPGKIILGNSAESRPGSGS